ncbi:hypothetical protein MUP00_00615 [Candidatus Bathyarchaeota archaeon]|nr:hypothetical protein [Candidatus Bathyarchaeota archaeon]
MVLGTLHNKENEAEVSAEFQKLGVQVIYLRDVLASTSMSAAPAKFRTMRAGDTLHRRKTSGPT